jgi:hypothetical protein
VNDDASLQEPATSQQDAPERVMQHGVNAILDALGAATYSREKSEKFRASRDRLLQALRNKAEHQLVPAIREDQLKTFTFGDTIIIVVLTESGRQMNYVWPFLLLLRRFHADSLREEILLRGSLAIGEFYAVDDDSNTVMGPAVSDAASWYDKSDWIGVHATPRATLLIEALPENTGFPLENLAVFYDVPMKGALPTRALALNWPKVLLAPMMTPLPEGADRRRVFLDLLVRGEIPRGTEGKYTNTVNFFDHCVRLRDAAVARQRKEAPAF